MVQAPRWVIIWAVFRVTLGVLALLVATSPLIAAMPRREPPLILGGARERVPRLVPLDPRLPRGAQVAGKPRPTRDTQRICSFSRPVCVHAAPPRLPEAASALTALEWAYERVVLTLGLPEPLPDAGIGGSDALDVYLGDPAAELSVEADPLFPGVFTRAPAFCLLPELDSALLLRAATLCVAEAVALALDASEPPHLRRAFATSLWWMVGQPTSLDFEAIDEVQARPETAIATRERGPSSEGAALFFSYLEATRSAASPGELSAALFSAAASRRQAVDTHYDNEPDLFDVIRHSLNEDPARFGALMVDFAVSRAFIGQRDDGQHWSDLAWSGAFGRVRFDWVIPFSSLPRRVAIQPAIDSTGSALVWVKLDEVPIGASLGIRIDWEAPVSFQWQLVRLSPEGRELGRIDVPFQERGREAEARVTNLLGTHAILVVGTNLEGIELAHPFDPDVAPFEPHGVTLYLARL